MKVLEPCPEDVLEVLFTQHWSRVYGVLFRLVGEQAEAEDLALEVFWRYHNHPPAERDPLRIGGWLYRVAIRLGYNSLRAERRRRKYEQSAGQLSMEMDTPHDPIRMMEQSEQRQQVRQVLAHMKPRLAKVLILRYTGLSYAEIASALELSRGSVGTLLSRAELDFYQRYAQTWHGE